MDGFQGRLNGSVQRKLSLILSLVILGVAVVAGAFAFLNAFDEAHELQDDMLRQIAQLMDHQRLSPEPPAEAASAVNADEESRVFVQRVGAIPPSHLSVDESGVLPIPATVPDGLHTLDIRGEAFRVLVRTTVAGERIAVAQEAGLRNEIARDGALRTVMPLLILVPVLLLIVADLVRKMFRPIAALSQEVDQRAGQALHPLDDAHLPAEVQPFARAINGLLARVEQSVAGQRRFVADAAHELRSPLTALSLQAERLAETALSPQARERLDALRQGMARSRNLLDQLLALAKAQSDTRSLPTRVSVQQIYRQVLEELMPLAEARQIDIGVEGTQNVTVWASELELFTLVRNLVDNAIRYTPEGGRVDLFAEVSEGQAMLRVRDNGPGIAPAERERVFDPFYRTPGSAQMGSGLGLSIVQAIAQRLGAHIRLDFADPAGQTGLEISVRFPR